MKKLVLTSIAASLAVTSVLAGELTLISDLKVSGDARVRSVSQSGITAAAKEANEYYESRIRLSLDATTEDKIQVHTRVLVDNNKWGKNSDDGFTWDEGTVLVPFEKSFLYAGRLNDTYATKFYSSNGDKIDLGFVGYTPNPETLLYVFDYKAVEGNYNSTDGNFGFGTGNGDTDAYGIGGQVTVDKLLIGGRYVALDVSTTADSGVTFTNSNINLFDAFVSGEIAGLNLNAEIQTRDEDSNQFGAYLDVAKKFDKLKVGAIALVTRDGYVSGGDLEASYLTNDENGIGTLGRVGATGDTTLFALNTAYTINSKLSVEAGISMQSIDKSTFNSSKDLDITEYNLGLNYIIGKSSTASLKYAGASFDSNSVENVENVVAAIEIKF